MPGKARRHPVEIRTRPRIQALIYSHLRAELVRVTDLATKREMHQERDRPVWQGYLVVSDEDQLLEFLMNGP
jgi:hypothetical protein